MDHVTIEALSVTFAGIVLLWLIRVVVATKDEVMKISQTLFGPDGDSGMYHDFKFVERVVRLRKEYRTDETEA